MFTDQIFDAAHNRFASTGFNFKLIPNTDGELHATSRRFGTETMNRTAANLHPADRRTTSFRASFHNPSSIPRNNWRERNLSVNFDNSEVLKIAPLQSDKLASGYSANRQLWDGTSWRTERNTHTDQVRSFYRMKMNQPKPFQKAELRNSDGRLKLRQKVYDVSDK